MAPSVRGRHFYFNMTKQNAPGSRGTLTDQLFNEHEVSAALNASVHTLRNWRYRGKGPKYIKLSRCVRYRASDVEAFLAASTVEVQ